MCEGIGLRRGSLDLVILDPSLRSDGTIEVRCLNCDQCRYTPGNPTCIYGGPFDYVEVKGDKWDEWAYFKSLGVRSLVSKASLLGGRGRYIKHVPENVRVKYGMYDIKHYA